jgi:hypothetical protein
MKRNNNHKQAVAILKDPQFLFHVGEKIGELGVIGEERNRLILFLAGLSSAFAQPVSILIKGTSSSGKSNLIKNVVKLFPPELLLVRASLSTKAPVHGQDSLKGKILYLLEHRGGKDAQYLLREQQSEGEIAHEYATVTGSRRGTEVARRTGAPVVLTSTTKTQIFADDETRFASVWVDESAEQTLAVLKAAVRSEVSHSEPRLSDWHAAIRLLVRTPPVYAFPWWFEDIASKLPAQQIRVRRDWQRFLTFCRAIALCRRFIESHGAHRRRDLVTFSDYCIAYRLLNLAFSSTVHGVHEREISIAACVRKIHMRVDRPVSQTELAEELEWKRSLVYKFVKPAVVHGLVRYETGTWPQNVKRLVPIPGADPGFLPSPQSVFDGHEEIGPVATYVDPLTGKTRSYTAERRAKTAEVAPAVRK